MNEKGMRRFVEILEKMMVLMAAVSAEVQGNDQPLDSAIPTLTFSPTISTSQCCFSLPSRG
jgi:hypothetical protein